MPSRKIIGFEALARIKKGKKIYLPSEFIDYLEESPYLQAFEEWGFKEIIKQIQKWRIKFSINISARSFFEENFLNRFREIPLDILPNLCIEITERTIIKDMQRAKKILSELKKIGSQKKTLTIALDDFGTGYSSLHEIKELPVDILKIDRSFIQDMTKDKKNLNLVKAVINLAHNFGLSVCAEGVETEEQCKILSDLGCDYAMGFYLGKPLPEEQLDVLFFANPSPLPSSTRGQG